MDNVSPVKTVLGSFSQIASKEPLLVIHVFEITPSHLSFDQFNIFGNLNVCRPASHNFILECLLLYLSRGAEFISNTKGFSTCADLI